MAWGRRARQKSVPWVVTLLRTLRLTTARPTAGGNDDLSEATRVCVVPSAAASTAASPSTSTNKDVATNIGHAQESCTSACGDAVARLFMHEPSHSVGTKETSRPTMGSTHLHHIRQQTNWDCGVACLQMVADWLTSNDSTNSYERNEYWRNWLLKVAGTVSIWTVDLAWILHNMLQADLNHFGGFSFLFCSTTLSVNEELSDYSYYKESFAKDRIRVLDRFERLWQLQDPSVLFQTSAQCLPLNRVMECIQQSACIAIALVDNQILMGNTEKPYTGHYVVLLGVSHDSIHVQQAIQHDGSSSHGDTTFCLVVSDPGSKQSLNFYTPNQFERAWRSPGTDDDIIFVVKK